MFPLSSTLTLLLTSFTILASARASEPPLDCLVNSLTAETRKDSPYFRKLRETSPFQREQNRILQVPEVLASYQRALSSGKLSQTYYEKLGFTFEGSRIQAPDEGEILLRLEALVEQELSSRGIDPDTFLAPAKVFRNERGELQFVTPSQLSSLTSEQVNLWKPLDGILSDAEFRSCVSKGFFPVGSHPVLKRGQVEMTTFLMHDLAHFQGFLENPGYAHSFRRFWSTVQEGFVSTARPGAAIRKISDESTEFLSIVNPKIEPQIQVLVRELPAIDSSPEASEVVIARAKAIESWSTDKRESWIRSMTSTDLSHWEKPVAGNQLDPPHAEFFREKIAFRNPTYFAWKTQLTDLLKLQPLELSALITFAESGLKLQSSDFMGSFSHPSLVGSKTELWKVRHPNENWLKFHYQSASKLKFQGDDLLIPLIAAPAHLDERIAQLLAQGTPAAPTSFQARLWLASAETGGLPLLTEILTRKQEIRASSTFEEPGKSRTLQFLNLIQRAVIEGIHWSSSPELETLRENLKSGLPDEELQRRLLLLSPHQ